MIKSTIFTKNQLELIKKRMEGKRLTQVESNYLSKAIRPKLKEMASIDPNKILDKIEYNQKIKSIEKNIKKSILKNLKDAQAIIIYGSAIQTSYKEYNDIDILVITGKEISPTKEKVKKILKIKKILEKKSISSDIQIYSNKTIEKAHNRNPSLIYQLKDHKVIYGSFKAKNKPEVRKLDLKMKLDWSYLEENPRGIEIYKAMRNVLLVRLLLDKVVDNQKLKESLYDEIGKSLAQRLKTGQESRLDRKIALMRLKSLLEKTEKEVENKAWEKLTL